MKRVMVEKIASLSEFSETVYLGLYEQIWIRLGHYEYHFFPVSRLSNTIKLLRKNGELI